MKDKVAMGIEPFGEVEIKGEMNIKNIQARQKANKTIRENQIYTEGFQHGYRQAMDDFMNHMKNYAEEQKKEMK